MQGRMRILLMQALMALAFLVAPIGSQAQNSDSGLSGPVLDKSLYDIEKTETNCQKCLAEQSAFHSAVDQYAAARAVYEEGIDAVRESTDAFLKAREEAARLEKAHQDAVAQIDRLLIYRPEGESYNGSAVNEAQWAEEDAFKELEAAQGLLAQARADLEAKLRAVEVLRRATVEQMRAALRAQSAMYRCEFTCEPEELDLDEPIVSLPQVFVGGIPPEAIPTPENFLGIVAKCAKCQPLAEQVNQIRSARRSFASDAQSAYESMTQNLKTLERLGQEARALEVQERELYRHLLRYFSPEAPPENAHFLDQKYDSVDQSEAEAALRDISERRAANERDQKGLAEVIANQNRGLLEALAKYALYTQLLDAAQKRLSDCEQTCPESTEPDQQSSIFDPAYPVPENFGPMVATCPECQHLVDQLVKLMLDRREVAHDIQFDVQMLKHSRKVLEHATTEEAKLAQEERQMTQLLLIGEEGGANVDYALDRLFELEAEQFRLSEMRQRAVENIGEYEARISENMAKHAELSGEIDAVRAELEICEFNCKADDENAGGISVGDSGYDTAYPQPEPYRYITTDCPECQRFADSANRLLLTRYQLAHQIQSTASRIQAHEAALQDAQARLTGLEEREAELSPVGTNPLDADAETKAKLDRVDADRVATEGRIAGINEVIATERAALNAAIQRHAGLGRAIEAVLQLLANCQANCAPAAQPPAMTYGQDDFISTECPPCETLASLVNDAVGSAIAAERALQAAKDAFNDLNAQQKSRAQALSEAEAREASLNEEWLTSANADRQAEIDAELNEVDADRNRLEDAQKLEATETADALQAIEDAEAAFDAADQLVADLKVQLAECENQCVPADEGTGVALPEDPSPFVRTDCAPCEVLASMVNDAVGTLIGAERDLGAAQEKVAGLKAASKARSDRLTEVLAQEAALNTELLSGPSEARRGEINEELNGVDLERIDLEEALEIDPTDIAGADAEVQAAQMRVDDLTALVANLKAQLAECEKQCDPPDEGTGVALPEDPSPFVRTDCPPCEVLASMVNDAVGTLIGAERDLGAAQDKVASLKAASKTRSDRLTEVLAQEASLNTELLSGPSEARRAEINEELNGVDLERIALEDALEIDPTDIEMAETEAQAAQARVDDLTTLVANLKAQLAECEKQCAPPDEGTGVAVPGDGTQTTTDPRFASTDCPPCEQIVSALNDAIGSSITIGDQLTVAQGELDAVRADIERLQAEKTAAQDAFTEALVARNRAQNDGGDASGPAADMEAASQKAVDLLTEIETLEIRQLTLDDDVTELTEQLANWTRQIAILRPALADCEKQCVETATPPAIDLPENTTPETQQTSLTPEMLLDKLQPENCRAGTECTFEIKASNAGEGVFSGPLFLNESGSVATGANGAGFGDWHCSRSGGGRSICVYPKDIVPGTSAALTVQIRLPGFVRAGTENCVEVAFAVDERALVRMVQVGLAARGYNTGIADGLPGPRTYAAIAAFGETIGREFDPSDMAAIYEAMFGKPPVAEGAVAKQCIDMQVTNPVRRTTTTSTATPRAAQTPPAAEPEPEPEQESNRPRIKIGIGFGIGLGSDRHERGDSIIPGGGHYGRE